MYIQKTRLSDKKKC